MEHLVAASAGSECADERGGSRASRPSATLQVLIRRYGLGGARAQNRRELGARLGIDEARCRLLEREALHWLRELPRARERGA
jgi:hypothetical protein